MRSIVDAIEMRSIVDARSRISNWDLIVDKITNITADQIDKTLIC